MSPLLDHIETMRKALKEGERAARRAQYRFTAKLALLLAGALISTGTTARLIELEREWWLTTGGVILAVAWGRAASRAAGEVQEARKMRDGLAHAVECLPDDELLDFLNMFMAGRAPAPTVDEDPTPVPSAPDSPAPTPEGTNPA